MELLLLKFLGDFILQHNFFLLRRPLNDLNDRKVALRGNPDQIRMAKTFIEDIVRNISNERLLLGSHKQQPLFLTSDSTLNGDNNHQTTKTTSEYEELTVTDAG